MRIELVSDFNQILDMMNWVEFAMLPFLLREGAKCLFDE